MSKFIIKEGKMIEILSAEKITGIIKSTYNDYEERIKRLQDKIKELEDEHWKDKELQEMEEKYKQMRNDYYRGFPISEEEKDEINKWKNKHIEEKHNGNHYAGAIGGRFSFIFVPTSMGTAGCVRCSCGEEFEFQHIE